MRDRGRNSTGANSGYILDSGRPYYGGRDWATEETSPNLGGNGPDALGDIQPLATVRKAIEGGKRDWTDFAIIGGAILLVGAIFLTLLLSLGINARANRIIEGSISSDDQRGRIEATVDRIETKVNDLGTTTTTTTIAGRTTTTVRGNTVVNAPPVTVYVYVPPPVTSPPTTSRPTTTTTTRPCSLALLNLCIL